MTGYTLWRSDAGARAEQKATYRYLFIYTNSQFMNYPIHILEASSFVSSCLIYVLVGWLIEGD